ncbi:MAG TPA: BamA/TamA family outer membrane protein [Thermoanaerobaculia bacterium]|nr:BamA/TamA family outer membrane protein [Thermoanaerobaculia bacterium]
MKRFLIPSLLLVAAALFAQPVTPPRIGKITIETVDVYSNAEAQHGFFYRTADRLHIETRDSVVRKYLLFREGDEYRPERLQETERNLRGQPYLKSATVTALPPHDGVVDIVVTTQDAWSIAPETQAGNKGGATNYGASISDTNLFGYGKEAEVSWSKDIDRTRVGVNYIDPMLFDGYWNAHVAYGRTSDGNDQRLAVRRPFYSFSTPWATEFSFAGFRRDDKIYTDGVVAERFSHQMRSAVASWGWALDPTDSVANRIVGGVRLSRDRFLTLLPQESFALPSDREYRYLFARLEHAENSFVKLNFVNKDVRYEDFNLGRQYSIEGAVSPRIAGAPVNSAYGSIAISDGVAAGPTAFLLNSASLQSRFDGGAQNAVASGMLYVVKRSGEDHPSTFVGRIVLNNAWRQDPEDQFFADGLNGLRGYRAHSFAGSRSLIINAEQRFYLGRELLQLYSPGLVGFVDAGNATDGSFGDLMRLKIDAGIGIRIGLPRTPKNLLRIDLAYAFSRDPLGRKGFLVSFSSGQAF